MKTDIIYFISDGSLYAKANINHVYKCVASTKRKKVGDYLINPSYVRIRIVTCIAEGIEYLRRLNVPIYHDYLKKEETE